MDALALATQGRPGLAHLVRVVRFPMRRVVVRFMSRALERPELEQAKTIMADAPPDPSQGPKVLFMTFRAWTSHAAWEVTIAQALRLRGARCEFFFCGGGLPICEIGWPGEDRKTPCDSCGSYVAAMIDAAHFCRHSLDAFVPGEECASIDRKVRTGFDARRLDDAARQSLMWFFRSAHLPNTPTVEKAREDFRVGAAIMTAAAQRVLDALVPDIVVMVNGLFYEDRLVREAAKARGIRVVSYEVGAQAGTLYFSGERPAAEYDISELWDQTRDQPLSLASEAALDAVLSSRRSGTGLSRKYYARHRDLRTRGGVPLVAVFTNVSWDTAATLASPAFGSMFDWVRETMAIAEAHPHLDFVIRAHPAESRWPGLETNESLETFVGCEFTCVPHNVRFVSAREAIDSYQLIEAADIVSVFASTVGLEAAASGKPVCVAGMTHYRGRGFTLDVSSIAHYHELFDDLSWTQPDSRRRDLARRYAYSFFCRAMLPFGAVIEDEPSEPMLTYSSINDLEPGRDAVLDIICDGIVGRSSFSIDSRD